MTQIFRLCPVGETINFKICNRDISLDDQKEERKTTRVERTLAFFKSVV